MLLSALTYEYFKPAWLQVDGSHLYFPSKVQLDDVILPEEQKRLITESVVNFGAYKRVRKMMELTDSSEWLPKVLACS